MNRAELKSRAKEILKKYYWNLFGVSIIGLILTLGFISVDAQVDFVTNMQTYYLKLFIFKFNLGNGAYAASLISLLGMLLFVFSILVGNVVRYGVANSYKYASYDELDHFDIMSGFKSNYKKIVITKILQTVYIFLWSLLLIVPGIIKAYEYRFVDYLLEEHPELSSKEILQLSKQITFGHKAELLVLDFSFILWYIAAGILDLLTFGLASIALDPYTTSTDVQAYHWMVNLQSFDTYIEG
ncbi:MAG: DUF975 family protein [Erysipelotrichaceae bacterium]|nr:DUF975 family protein [Erysipelotrichaceae bacterium]